MLSTNRRSVEVKRFEISYHKDIHRCVIATFDCIIFLRVYALFST